MQRARSLLLSLAITACLPTPFSAINPPQNNRTYQQMTLAERGGFVSLEARHIARKISGREYEFTPAFEAEIQKAVDFYARRIGNGAGEQAGKGDARIVFERGQTLAPNLIAVFKARNVSPLIGLYLPLIESEYINIQSPNEAGAVGMFQFLPKTGEHYGLNSADLLDVQKSADAAARYIAGGIERFDGDHMKEALAVLSYNRGVVKVEQDLAALINDQNRRCSICAITEQRDKLDADFQHESVYYVPRFFAAAIVGENPQVFGLHTPPLSSL
jgi:hypothetical protein